MLRSLRTAERAMQLEQVRVEALANNLANVNSNGFQQVLTTVQQLGSVPVSRTDSDARALMDQSMAASGRSRASRGAWPKQLAIDLVPALDIRPGTLRVTGRATDVAVVGKGFFVVETPTGQLYTRDGSFNVDGDGRLVTADGYPVLGTGGPLEIGGGTLTIHEDGSVAVGDAPRGRLRLVEFADANRLEHRGSSLLAAPPDLQPENIPPERTRVAQGQLESSNVNAVETLVDLIAAQRSFEIASRVVQANDELLEKSVNEISRVR